MYFGFNYSSALLVILSTEKFIALYFPLKTKSVCTVRIAKRVSMVTAVIFIAFDAQFLVLGEVTSDLYGEYCIYTNVSDQYLKILFGILIAILYSFGPFAIMTLTNMGIIYKFIAARWRSRGGGTESTNQALSKSATRGTAMLLTISFAFIILTGPIAIVNAIWNNGRIPKLIHNTALAMQYMNHSINGVLYCVSGSRFRNELMKTFRLKRFVRKQSSYIGSSSNGNSSQYPGTTTSEINVHI